VRCAAIKRQPEKGFQAADGGCSRTEAWVWRRNAMRMVEYIRNNHFSGCLFMFRQPEIFTKPKTLREISTSVIPAQAGILIELTQ